MTSLRIGGLAAAAVLGSFCFALFASTAYAQAANLIQNPTLETAGVGGVPANWVKTYWGTPTPTFTYPTAGHAGNGAMVAFGANSNGDARWQPDAVAVEAGATYTYSAWYKSNVASEIDTEFMSASGATSYGWVADVPSSANAWKQLTAQFTIPSGITKVSIFQIIWKTGNLTVDDVSLTKNGSTPPPPPATPTLTLSASPTSITSGQSSTLTWSSTNTTGCTASNGWTGAKAVSGNETVSPTANATYVLSCTGAGGNVSQQVTITVSATPPPPGTPTLTFTASPNPITAGQQSTLTWSSTNATGCTASGGWSGSRAVSGTQAVTPSATTLYTLLCTGAGGNVSKNVTITVNAVPPPPTPGQFTEGMVSLTFDDSWLTQYTNALPILQAAGLKGTFYLTTQPIKELWDEFMIPNQVKDIAQKGHEIAGHTVTHADLTTLSNAKINQEIKNSKTYLQNLTGQTVVSLAYPYGSVSTKVKNLTKNAGYTSARGVDFETLNVSTTDKYDLKSHCIETSDSMTSIKAQIDAAKANKQWYILCIHEVKDGGDQYSTTPARFQEIVNYITSIGITVVTVKEGRALMAN